jgi:hypothetical protein
MFPADELLQTFAGEAFYKFPFANGLPGGYNEDNDRPFEAKEMMELFRGTNF